jgi:hypothetical protein
MNPPCSLWRGRRPGRPRLTREGHTFAFTHPNRHTLRRTRAECGPYSPIAYRVIQSRRRLGAGTERCLRGVAPSPAIAQERAGRPLRPASVWPASQYAVAPAPRLRRDDDDDDDERQRFDADRPPTRFFSEQRPGDAPGVPSPSPILSVSLRLPPIIVRYRHAP